MEAMEKLAEHRPKKGPANWKRGPVFDGMIEDEKWSIPMLKGANGIRDGKESANLRILHSSQN